MIKTTQTFSSKGAIRQTISRFIHYYYYYYTLLDLSGILLYCATWDRPQEQNQRTWATEMNDNSQDMGERKIETIKQKHKRFPSKSSISKILMALAILMLKHWVARRLKTSLLLRKGNKMTSPFHSSISRCLRQRCWQQLEVILLLCTQHSSLEKETLNIPSLSTFSWNSLDHSGSPKKVDAFHPHD